MSYEELWQSQPLKLAQVDIDEIARKARRFERTIKIRNWSEWVAAIIVFPFLVLIALSPMPVLSRVSGGFLALWTIFISAVLARYGRLRPLPDPTQSTKAFLTAQRERLTSQANLLARVPFWYVGPAALGIVGVYLGILLEVPNHWGDFWSRFKGPLLVTALFLGFVMWNNLRASKKLRAEAARYEVDD